MTLRLILMRHAKSSWDDPTLEDHDRVLNKRGRASASALGDWMRDTAVLPDQVLCSTAARTQETLERLRLDAPVLLSKGLYMAGEDRMMDMIQSQQAQTVMVLAHNPGIGDLAHRIVAKPPPHAGFAHYPTGATTVMGFDAPTWGHISFGMGRVEAFITPRDLMDNP